MFGLWLTLVFTQISSFTQQATLLDALTVEECEYIAFAILCIISFVFNWSVVLIYVINVFISDLPWEIILLKHVPPFLLSLASSSWQQVLG